MLNAFISRAASILSGLDMLTEVRDAPAAQPPPAAPQRVGAPPQTPNAGVDGISAEEAIQAQLLAEVSPVTVSAPSAAAANAPVWTTGTFIDVARQAAADQAARQQQQPQPNVALTGNALALYREFTAQWRTQNPGAQPSAPQPGVPAATPGQSLVPASTPLPQQPGIPFTRQSRRDARTGAQQRAPQANSATSAPVANVAGGTAPVPSPAPTPAAQPSKARNPFAQRDNAAVPAPPAKVPTMAPVANAAGTVTPCQSSVPAPPPRRPRRQQRRQQRNPFAQGGSVPAPAPSAPAPPESLPIAAPGANVAGTVVPAANVAGVTGTSTGIPGNVQPRSREVFDTWINDFLSSRQQEEKATAARGSMAAPGTAAGSGGSRQAQPANVQRPAGTAAPSRQPQPVTPGNHPVHQGVHPPVLPTPAATSASSAFPTPVIVSPAPAFAPTPGRQATGPPLGSPQTKPASSAFPDPVVVTPYSAPSPAPAAATPATSKGWQPKVPATRRGAISRTPRTAPNSASYFATLTPGTPALAPGQFMGRPPTRGGRQSGRGGQVSTGRPASTKIHGHTGTQAPPSWPAFAKAPVIPQTTLSSKAAPTPGVGTPAPTPAAAKWPATAGFSQLGPGPAPKSQRPPPPEQLTPPARGASTQLGASASSTNPTPPAAPVYGGPGSYQSVQQTGEEPVDISTATPQRLQDKLNQSKLIVWDGRDGWGTDGVDSGPPVGAQWSGSRKRGWTSRADLFHEETLVRDGVEVPSSRDEQPRPMPTAPSRVDISDNDVKTGDTQLPGSILQKRPAGTASAAGDPKRVRFARS